ncbi:MAG: hypothetical protein ACFFG0_50560 [Candidatus Thorarchaeota archaeon]
MFFRNFFASKPKTPIEIIQSQKLIEQLKIPKAMKLLQEGLAKHKDNKSKNQIRVALAAIYCEVYVDTHLIDKEAPKIMYTHYLQKAYNTLNEITNTELKNQNLFKFGEKYNQTNQLLRDITQPKDLIIQAKLNKKIGKLNTAFKYLEKIFNMKNNIDNKLLPKLSHCFNDLGIDYYKKQKLCKQKSDKQKLLENAIECIKYAILSNPQAITEIEYNLIKAAKTADKVIGNKSTKWQLDVKKFLDEVRHPKKKENKNTKENNKKKKKNIPLKQHKKTPPPTPKTKHKEKITPHTKNIINM